MKVLRKMKIFILLLAISISLCGCKAEVEVSDDLSESTTSTSENDNYSTIASTDEVSALWNKYVVGGKVDKINAVFHPISQYMSSISAEHEVEHLFEDKATIDPVVNSLKEIGDIPCQILDSYPAEHVWVDGGYGSFEFINNDETVFTIRIDLLENEDSKFAVISVNNNAYFKINNDDLQIIRLLNNVFNIFYIK